MPESTLRESMLCAIPARGGSKRLPRKNLRALAGKPMIAYTIEQALQSALFDEVYVCTEDREIADVVAESAAGDQIGRRHVLLIRSITHQQGRRVPRLLVDARIERPAIDRTNGGVSAGVFEHHILQL